MVHVIAAVVLVLATTSAVQAQLLSGGGSLPQPQFIPGQFIVELHPGHSQDDVIRAHSLAPLQRWQIVNGFVAHMSDVAADQLRADSRVKLVVQDVLISAFGRPSGGGGGGKGGGGVPPACPDTSAAKGVAEAIPTGVQRIGASKSPVGNVTGVKTAIIDTGIDDCHPELNVPGGTNIIDSTKSPRDDNGHGTHVSGIVAARSGNGFGVAGVAPGAPLYSVKILDASGSGALSSIPTALDWAVKNQIKVANMSLAGVDSLCVLIGYCGQGTECTAISNAVAKGLTVVVAAGNSADDALYYTPANCANSLTVSAFVDSDGAPGGHGGSFIIGGQTENDDTFAQSFSNHSQYYWDINGDGVLDLRDHPIIDFMAPGVAIRSTMPTYPVTLTTQYGYLQNYDSLTGTSMASPHVAGAVVRYLAAHPGATPEQIRKALLAAGECPDGLAPGTLGGLLCNTRWPDDPDPDPSEPLIHITDF